MVPCLNPVKPRSIREMIMAKERLEQGTETPACVWEVHPDGRGGFTRRKLNPKAFQRAQQAVWDKSIRATRRKLGLSQLKFAQSLGINVRTLHHWEQGTRTPTGAARVLLRVAAEHPEVVLAAAA